MIGCLCLHGFTGAPYEVEPLVSYLQKHTDWRIVVPTLPGHGERLQLRGVSYNDWLAHAEQELQLLTESCDTIYVIGFSMGGMIASYLSVHYPVDKLVLLSAAAYYVHPKQLFLDLKELLTETKQGRLKDNELFQRYARKMKETPLAATLQFRRLVQFIRPQLSRIQVPTLIAQGEVDGIVPPKSARYLFDCIAAREKKVVFYKKAKHLICYGEEREQLFEEVFEFLQPKS